MECTLHAVVGVATRRPTRGSLLTLSTFFTHLWFTHLLANYGSPPTMPVIYYILHKFKERKRVGWTRKERIATQTRSCHWDPPPLSPKSSPCCPLFLPPNFQSHPQYTPAADLPGLVYPCWACGSSFKWSSSSIIFALLLNLLQLHIRRLD